MKKDTPKSPMLGDARVRAWRLAALLIALAVMAAALPSCHRHSAQWERMLHAESVIEEEPDSALAVMLGIPSESVLGSEEKARYSLLMSMALDMNGLYETNDSLIQIAQNHYSHARGPKGHLIKSIYYHGRIKANQRDYSSALLLFTKSLNLAIQDSAMAWVGRSAQQIADIFDATMHREESLNSAAMAYEAFAKAGMRRHANFAIAELARLNLNAGHYAAADSLAQIAIAKARSEDDPALLAAALETLGQSQYARRDFQSALSTFQQAVATGFYSPETLPVFGQCLLFTGHGAEAEAVSAWQPADGSNALGWLALSREISKSKGDLTGALSLTERLMAMSDSMLSEGLSQDFETALSSHYAYEDALSRMEVRNARSALWIVILSGIIGLAALGTFATWLIKRLKRTQKEKAKMQLLHQDEISKKEKEIEFLRGKFGEAFLSRYSELERMARIRFELPKGEEDGKSAATAEKFLKDFSLNGEKTGVLENAVNEYTDGALARLRASFPTLKSADYLLFAYAALGFSHQAMAVLLGEEKIEAVYNRKARLKTRIRNSELPDKAALLAVLG